MVGGGGGDVGYVSGMGLPGEMLRFTERYVRMYRGTPAFTMFGSTTT